MNHEINILTGISCLKVSTQQNIKSGFIGYWVYFKYIMFDMLLTDHE